MNGFEKHGLKHTSPSQLNMWADAPCAWIAQYLYGKRSAFSVAAQVGVLTEQVVATVLRGTNDFDSALKFAKETFYKDNALNTNQKDVERVNDIEPMAKLALEELKQYGEPNFTLDGQHKISLNCKGDGWELPVIGFIDFYYPDHGLIVDLKTTLRMPSNMSDPHKRQGAVYQKAMGNMGVKFLYVTPKKSCVFDIEGGADTLREVKEILNRQERFLRLGDAELLRSIVPVNTSSFYWTGSEMVRKELYGI